MTRYLVFSGDKYYPSGGLSDFHTSFESLEQAIGFANGIVAGDCLKWAHVAKLETRDGGLGLSIIHFA